MYMIDFSYAGRRLSDINCSVLCINTSSASDNSLGNKIKFDTIKNRSNHINQIIEVDYEDPEPIIFDIGKNPCLEDNLEFSDIEVSHIMSWLNKKRYERFRPIYNDSSYPDIYFKGSFNVTAIKVGGKIVGFTLTFMPNAPYGFDSEKTIDYNVEKNGEFVFYNNSDEYGYLYPDKFIITCNESGNFEMTNSLDANNTVKISNCVSGETITMDCQNKIIQTDSTSHSTLCKDFNYNFPRFVSSELDNKNVFISSLSCSIQITYSIIRKAGIIV